MTIETELSTIAELADLREEVKRLRATLEQIAELNDPPHDAAAAWHEARHIALTTIRRNNSWKANETEGHQ